VRLMVDELGNPDAFYSDWFEAEARYAQALDAFSTDGPPPVVLKESALELARVRNRADSARDKFFKRALK